MLYIDIKLKGVILMIIKGKKVYLKDEIKGVYLSAIIGADKYRSLIRKVIKSDIKEISHKEISYLWYLNEEDKYVGVEYMEIINDEIVVSYYKIDERGEWHRWTYEQVKLHGMVTNKLRE